MFPQSILKPRHVRGFLYQGRRACTHKSQLFGNRWLPQTTCANCAPDVQALFCCRRHQPMRGHFGRLVTRSSFVTTATVLLAITASSRKNPNSATLSGSEIKKLNFGGKQKYAAAKALANEVRTPTVLP